MRRRRRKEGARQDEVQVMRDRSRNEENVSIMEAEKESGLHATGSPRGRICTMLLEKWRTQRRGRRYVHRHCIPGSFRGPTVQLLLDIHWIKKVHSRSSAFNSCPNRNEYSEL